LYTEPGKSIYPDWQDDGRQAVTEAEWLAAVQFDDAMCSTAIGSQGWSFRKETLFSVACSRRVLSLLPDERGARLLAEFEVAALAPTPSASYARPLSDYVIEALQDSESTADPRLLFALGAVTRGYISQVAEDCALAVAGAKRRGWVTVEPDPEEGRAQAGIIRDIVGNPFRPVSFSLSWRTDTVLALAHQMYESREFSAMPILADALQDAGCDSADILSHCRAKQEHVRGCWVVGLVLENQ
jgi:hypothetical protein